MASMPPYARFERIIDRTTGLFLAAGLIWLPAMMILTVGDVFGRYLFSAPIPGSRELNELMLLSMTVFGLGHCHREKGNVKITLLSDFLPARARAFLLVAGLSPTSTMRAAPFSSTWVRSMAAQPLWKSRFFFLLPAVAASGPGSGAAA